MTDLLGYGKAVERAVTNYLLKKGIAKAVYSVPRTKFTQQDIYRLFDAIYLPANRNRFGETVYVQVCHKKSFAKHKEALFQWVPRWYLSKKIEYWVYDDKEMKRYVYIASVDDYEEALVEKAKQDFKAFMALTYPVLA